MAVALLQRRSAPVTYYSIYDGDRLMAGRADLRPPPDYGADGRLSRRCIRARLYGDIARSVLTRGYVDPRDAEGWSSPPICARPQWPPGADRNRNADPET
jgi:two-component system sensor histidine kinase TctE